MRRPRGTKNPAGLMPAGLGDANCARTEREDAMAEQISSDGPVRVRVSNKWVPARPHSARRWGAKAIAAFAFVALIVGAGSVSNVWLPEKWSGTDLHAALDPLTAQDTKSNPDISLNVAEGGPMAQWKLGRMYTSGDGVAQDD